MNKLQFGTGLRSVADTAAFARRAEALGYDVLGCGEHVMFHGPIGNTFVQLAVAAGATERIRLMSTIALLPLYPATLAAKMGSVLDVASAGRYLCGIGVGGEFPKEFEACGVPVAERGARATEAMQVLRKLWTEREVSFHGRFNTLNQITLDPPPVQQPPPIWVAGRKEAAMRRAALFGDGWIPYMYTPELLAESMTSIGRLRAENPVAATEFNYGVFIFSAVHRDGDVARKMAAERLGRQYAQNFENLVGKYALIGTPAECRQRLRQYVDTGATLFMLTSACPDDYIDENIRLLAEEVIPEFR
jgi:probable F420-dependent oxidoreductase